MNKVARCGIGLIVLTVAGLCRAQQWQAGPIALPADGKYPCIAVTAQELARLQQAYEKGGEAGEVVARIVREPDRAMARPLQFPPRGGQHNQWYQCEACQMGLRTIDETHHRCPKCGKIYSGAPYDDVIYAHQHEANLRAAYAAAWAHAITGKKEYAEFAGKILLGYAQRYSDYPYHSADNRTGAKASRTGGHLFEQTLNEAADMATRIGPACDLVFDALSAQDRAAIRAGLILPMLENIDKYKAGKGNWQTWHNAGMVWGGAVMGDASWVRKAIEDPQNGFAFQMKTSLSAEGMWYENSWGYHFYTLHGLVATAEGCRRLGIDLWSHPSLRSMFTLPARYTMSNGSLPRFGDDVNSSARRVPQLMEPAYAAYKDQAIAALLPKEPTWESILAGRTALDVRPLELKGSEVFPGAGHAILRSRGEANLSAALTFGPYGGFHGHFDKLSFVFFGYGKELGVDPGRAASQAYRLPIHSRWYKATISHNAVLVDAAAQKPASGSLELFGANETHAAVMARCDEAYPGVMQRRLLCMGPKFLVIFDELAAEKERRFDWIYHQRAGRADCADAETDDDLGQGYAGAEFLKNLKRGMVDGEVKIDFGSDDVATRLSVAGAPGTEVRIGDGPGASVLDRVPLAMITRRGKLARFAAVLEPRKNRGDIGVGAISLQEVGGGVRITVEDGGRREEITLTGDRKLAWMSGGETVLEASASAAK